VGRRGTLRTLSSSPAKVHEGGREPSFCKRASKEYVGTKKRPSQSGSTEGGPYQKKKQLSKGGKKIARTTTLVWIIDSAANVTREAECSTLNFRDPTRLADRGNEASRKIGFIPQLKKRSTKRKGIIREGRGEKLKSVGLGGKRGTFGYISLGTPPCPS